MCCLDRQIIKPIKNFVGRHYPMACEIGPLYPTSVHFQRAREKSGDGQTSFLFQRLWTVHTKAKRQEIKNLSFFLKRNILIQIYTQLAMADTAVDTTATAEVTAKELKEKKEAEVEEEKKTGSGDAPANGTNGADHSDKVETAEEEHKNGNGNAEEAPPAEEAEAQPVKRAAEEEEEKVETKKQKTEENGESKEAEVEA